MKEGNVLEDGYWNPAEWTEFAVNPNSIWWFWATQVAVLNLFWSRSREKVSSFECHVFHCAQTHTHSNVWMKANSICKCVCVMWGCLAFHLPPMPVLTTPTPPNPKCGNVHYVLHTTTFISSCVSPCLCISLSLFFSFTTSHYREHWDESLGSGRPAPSDWRIFI